MSTRAILFNGKTKLFKENYQRIYLSFYNFNIESTGEFKNLWSNYMLCTLTCKHVYICVHHMHEYSYSICVCTNVCIYSHVLNTSWVMSTTTITEIISPYWHTLSSAPDYLEIANLCWTLLFLNRSLLDITNGVWCHLHLSMDPLLWFSSNFPPWWHMDAISNTFY